MAERWLQAVLPVEDLDAQSGDVSDNGRQRRESNLRKPLASLLMVLVVLGFGGFRWAPLMLGEIALIGLAAPAPERSVAAAEAVAVSWLDENQQACRQLRIRQLQAEINEAARQYRATNGTYPEALEHLVSAGLLPRDTWRTVGRLGWQYARLEAGRAYRLNL